MTWTTLTEANFNDIYAESRWNNQVKGNLEHIRDNVVEIPLPMISALSPLSGITPAAMSQVESSASNPKPNFLIHSADDSSDEGLQWQVVVPALYGTGGTLQVKYYKSSGTTGAVVFAAQIAAVSDDEIITSKAYDSVNTVTDTVPSTAGYVTTAEITLTNRDSMAAGDLVNVYLYRDANNGSDTTIGDVNIVSARILGQIA